MSGWGMRVVGRVDKVSFVLGGFGADAVFALALASVFPPVAEGN